MSNGHSQTNRGPSLWWMLLHLVCCGGAAAILLVSGAGLAGAGVVRASFWLLIVGFAVIGVAVMLRYRRRSRRVDGN